MTQGFFSRISSFARTLAASFLSVFIWVHLRFTCVNCIVMGFSRDNFLPRLVQPKRVTAVPFHAAHGVKKLYKALPAQSPRLQES